MGLPRAWIADTDGDGTGTTNAVGNYASAAEVFKVTGGADTTVYGPGTGALAVYRLVGQIGVAGNPDAAAYGNDIPLTNGIVLGVWDSSDTLVVDYTDGDPILTNSDWSRLAYDVEVSDYGIGDNFVRVRLTFSKFGGPIVIPEGHYVGVECHDDLTDLVTHKFTFEGVGTRLAP